MDNDEERVMHSKSDNIQIMINDGADEVIKQIFNLLKNRYQNDIKWMVASISSIKFSCCIINLIK